MKLFPMMTFGLLGDKYSPADLEVPNLFMLTISLAEKCSDGRV